MSNAFIIKKQFIANSIFVMLVLYMLSPWLFEKYFFFNEFISLIGFCVFLYKGLKLPVKHIGLCVTLMLGLGLFHLVVSITNYDSFYYYLRNSVIIYSIFSFFIGYYLFMYFERFLEKIKNTLRVYVYGSVLIPIHVFILDRFNGIVFFGLLVSNYRYQILVMSIAAWCFIYGFTHSSLTALIASAFFLLLAFIKNYYSFKWFALLSFVVFWLLMFYLNPYLELIKFNYSPYDEYAIYQVINSHPLLKIDANNTWRLVLWKQVIIDMFPQNLIGIGFGTPLLKYFPIENLEKLDILPYVIGTHNSYIYLLGRLGIISSAIFLYLYHIIFKEYFTYKNYYHKNRYLLYFASFFGITLIAAFNPVLESPIYASTYWFTLGLVGAAIKARKADNQITYQ